jgi:glycosyltransferase involved in cell wall biosynthesis
VSAVLADDIIHVSGKPAGAAGGRPPKVLYALDSFPQLSESYINAEIQRMQSWGVHVEVWSKREPLSEDVCNVVVHRGRLADAIREVDPDVVHTHWTKTALKYKDAAKSLGVPVTSRGHWHFVPKQLVRIEQEDAIVRLYMFPHLAERYGSVAPKIRSMHSCFHQEWMAPDRPKNRRMVARTAACKKPKDLAMFIRVASKLPGYRFVMILCSLGPNDHYRELEQLNRDLGSPVEMVRDISHEQVAAYLGEAGIYLHTYSTEVPFGMPVSIAEAMAAGCTVIARDMEGAASYVGDAGRLYRTEEEAVRLVRDTENWSDEAWAAAKKRSRDRAAAEFDDRKVLRPLYEDWVRIAATQDRSARRIPLASRLRRWVGLA